MGFPTENVMTVKNSIEVNIKKVLEMTKISLSEFTGKLTDKDILVEYPINHVEYMEKTHDDGYDYLQSSIRYWEDPDDYDFTDSEFC